MTCCPKITILVAGLLICIPVTLASILLSKKWGFFDQPKIEKHKAHAKPTPLAGGISLFITLFLVQLIFGRQWEDLGVNSLYFFAGTAVIFLVGLLDDIFIFSATIKFLGQSLGVMLVILAGFSISLFPNTVANIAITLFWFIGIINAFNFLDGSDGMILQAGIVITGFAYLFTNLSGQMPLQNFILALLGILLGLLIFNFRPAKMFMGDAGSQLVGLLLALIVLNYNPLGFDRTSSWITPVLMMSVPIFDVTLVVISRLLRKIPVAVGGLDHTYHRLIQKGIPSQFATIIIVIAVAVTNGLAHLTLVINRDYAYIILIAAVLIGALLLFWLEKTFQSEQ